MVTTNPSWLQTAENWPEIDTNRFNQSKFKTVQNGPKTTHNCPKMTEKPGLPIVKAYPISPSTA